MKVLNHNFKQNLYLEGEVYQIENTLMKVMIIILTLACTFSCTSNSDSQTASEQTQTKENYLITPSDFKTKMDEKDIVVLDVRTPAEVAEGVIGTPVIVNYRDADFKEQLLALDKSKTYLVYCKGGGRSGQAKSLMDASGFESVYDLQGGITAWRSAGLATD